METTTTLWNTFKAGGEDVLQKIKELVHEGNVRRVVVRHGDRTVAEFPLSAGVVGAVVAPVLAAIAALVALMKDCVIDVERIDAPPPPEREEVVAAHTPVDESC